VSFALAASVACESSGSKNEAAARGVVIVNAPAAGEVRRVFVQEGMSLDEGSPVVEIAVRTETPNAPPPQQAPTEDPQARAGRNIQAAQAGIEAARAEVVRAEVEVQRLTPLAASGEAPQGQLDGARADYERAQQRFQQAQAAAQNAQSGLVVARQQSRNSTSATTTTMTTVAPSEQLIVARATAAGTVSAINARVGQQVTAGQPLATLRSGQR
jgi:multidrug efflux pump subunit AcrA (membrane-fusion protein)